MSSHYVPHTKIPTLVCCGAGMSRSPAIVAAALALVERAPFEDCLRRVARHHPSDVSPGLWSEVVKLPSALLELGRPGP